MEAKKKTGSAPKARSSKAASQKAAAPKDGASPGKVRRKKAPETPSVAVPEAPAPAPAVEAPSRGAAGGAASVAVTEASPAPKEEQGIYPFPAKAAVPQSAYPFAQKGEEAAPPAVENSAGPYPFAARAEAPAAAPESPGPYPFVARNDAPRREEPAPDAKSVPPPTEAPAPKLPVYPFAGAGAPQAPPPPSAQQAPASPAGEPEEEARIKVELEQLQEMIKDLPFLEYLNSRIERIMDGRKSYRDLVGFYRLISRGLKEEFEKLLERARSLVGEVEELRRRPPGHDGPAEPMDRDGAELLTMRRLLDAKESVLMDYMQQLESMKQDVQNIRSRAKGEVEQRIERANEELLRKLLPVLDNFDRAVAAAKVAPNVGSVLSGITMIQRQFEEVLEKEGLTCIKAVGEPFDPHYHEALMEIFTSEMPEDTVYEEITRGWTFGKRVVRPAMVKVAKAPR